MRWLLKLERKPGKFGNLFYFGTTRSTIGGGSIRIQPECYGNFLALWSCYPYKFLWLTTYGRLREPPYNGTGLRSYWYGSYGSADIFDFYSGPFGYIRKWLPCKSKSNCKRLRTTAIPYTTLTCARKQLCGSPGTKPETLHKHNLHTQNHCNARHT